MTPATRRKMLQLARALTAEDLRALAVEVGMPEAHSRQLPGLVDALIAEYHDALLDRFERGRRRMYRGNKSRRGDELHRIRNRPRRLIFERA